MLSVERSLVETLNRGGLLCDGAVLFAFESGFEVNIDFLLILLTTDLEEMAFLQP